MIADERVSQEYIRRFGLDFVDSPPKKVLEWALAEFDPAIALACSFGAEDVTLVDMVAKINSKTKIFYLDTDLLFPETCEVRDRLVEKYAVNFVAYKSSLSLEDQSARYGEHLYRRDPDLCCRIRKVEPLRRAVGDLRAWITGIRREQSPARAAAHIIEWDYKFNLAKVNPLAMWTSAQVWDYIRSNGVPYNVLHDRNYPSIGCMPCTRAINPGEDPRSGRWAGFKKTECGLHQ